MALEVFISLVVIGFLFLIKGADWFLDAVVRIAHNFGVSEFIIGVSIVGIGTSLPEIASTLTSISIGHPELAIGDIIGSNIANIGLVIGITALTRKIIVESKVVRADALIMLFTMGVAYVLLFNEVIGFTGGLILIALFLAYLYFLFQTKKELARKPEFTQFVEWFLEFKYVQGLAESGYSVAKFLTHKSANRRLLLRDTAIAGASLLGILLGANMMVNGAVGISQDLHIPESFIGMGLVAIGTSLPELSVSLSAVRRGMGNILLGNIIGSNIANSSLVLGLIAIYSPLHFSDLVPFVFGPMMLGIAAIFVYFMYRGQDITRKEAILLLMTYTLFFLTMLFLNTFPAQ